jgi:hypothetical protein
MSYFDDPPSGLLCLFFPSAGVVFPFLHSSQIYSIHTTGLEWESVSTPRARLPSRQPPIGKENA